jgi:hypothetical protein
VQARTHYDDIELFRQDEGAGFAEALGIKEVPSESTLRQRLAPLATKTSMRKLEGANLALLQNHRPSPLEINGRKYIPNDIDVTAMDNTGSHRENVGRTYKGCDGFAPIMSNLGEEGFLLQHPALVRMDSGNDSADTLEILRKSGHRFIVKRNLRRENKVKWLSHAMSQGKPECPREGKEVYIGTIEHHRPGGEKSTQAPLTTVYRITRRSIDKHGQALLIDEIEVDSYWVNLGESPEDIIELYHRHGTSEQFHSEIKSDMGLERFPSNVYKVNQLFLMLGAIAYNTLRCIDHRAKGLKRLWPKHLQRKKVKLSRRRVGSIIRDIINTAAKVVSHAGQKIIKLSRGWPWSRVILAIDQQLS